MKKFKSLKLLKEYIQTNNQPQQQDNRDFYVDSFNGGTPQFLVQIQGKDDLILGCFSNSTLAQNALSTYKRCQGMANKNENYYIIHRISLDPNKETMCRRKLHESIYDAVLNALNEDLIPGGKGDKLNEKDVDQDELAKGIKTEMEHTNDPKKAKEIALDHLSELPDYYSRLKKANLADELK